MPFHKTAELNAYIAGHADGFMDAESDLGRIPAEELSAVFDKLVVVDIFAPHQKPQYLAGYARGARGEKS